MSSGMGQGSSLPSRIQLNRTARNRGGIHPRDNWEWLLGPHLASHRSQHSHEIEILHNSPAVKLSNWYRISQSGMLQRTVAKPHSRSRRHVHEGSP